MPHVHRAKFVSRPARRRAKEQDGLEFLVLPSQSKGSADGSIDFPTAKKAERIVPCRRSTEEEFKASALELLNSGMIQKQVCQDLGISKSSLQLWVNHQRAERVPAENTAERAEQAKMLKRIRELEQENEILRRAAAYLSQANVKVGQAHPK